MSAPTIYDIAARAGVGIATVSRVINGSPRVSEKTRGLVQKAMSELGFRPNAAARRLAAGAPDRPRVAALMPFFTTTFYFNVCKALSAELSAAEVDLILVDVHGQEDADRKLDRLLVERSAEGVILCSLTITEERRAQFHHLAIPVVALDSQLEGVPHAAVENVEGGRLLTRTLSEKGSNKQALLLGNRQAEVFRDRETGFRAACPEGSRVFETDVLDIEGGMELVQYVLNEFPDVNGIACSCDSLAVGVMHGLRKLGRRVPEEIQVIGFDDQPLMDLLGLSTIRQPMQAFGMWAARSVVELIRNPSASIDDQIFPLEIVERQTTR